MDQAKGKVGRGGQMNNKQYEELAQRTSNTVTNEDKILNGLLGLSGEVGELVDHYKKYKFQGHELDELYMIDECSDVLWYIVELLNGLESNLSDCMTYNIGKLEKRYPEGYFKAERSINRKG